jgi:hypothetical protein
MVGIADAERGEGGGDGHGGVGCGFWVPLQPPPLVQTPTEYGSRARKLVQGVDGMVGRSSNFPFALPLMLISIASRHCSSGKVRAMGMLNFPAAAAYAISPNVS